MKLLIASILAALTVSLTGCASTVRSDVTAFHEWPSDLQSKSFVFEPPPKTPEGEMEYNTLEYQNYQNLVANELKRLGFSQSAAKESAALKVSMEYRVVLQNIRVAQPMPVSSIYFSAGWPYRARWHMGYHGRFYDPFWYSPMLYEYRDFDYPFYQRQLHIRISRASDDKRLYEVNVDNAGHQPSLAYAMPYMVRSAFTDFPGKSGAPHHVDLKFEDKPAQ